MEWEWYCDPNYPGFNGFSPFTVANSLLTITATQVSSLPSAVQSIFNAGGTGTDNIPGHYGGGAQWGASGTINSCGFFEQEFGYFEIRAKIPTIGACWPAFWLMPGTGQGFGSTFCEMDMIEGFGDKNASGQQYTDQSVYSNFHWNNYGNNINGVGGTSVGSDQPTVNEWGGLTPNAMSSSCGTSWQNVCLTPNLAGSFNTYGFLWRNGSIATYFNGGFSSYLGTADQSGDTFNNVGPCYMILNLAIGGSSGTGTPAGNENGAQIVVDWIAVYA
jgi:beta-glucanase (GH16 family)